MKSDLDRIQDRNAFEQETYNLLSDFLEERELYPEGLVLAVNKHSREVSIGALAEFSDAWECHNLESFFCEEEGETIPCCDAIADLAAYFFFIR